MGSAGAGPRDGGGPKARQQPAGGARWIAGADLKRWPISVTKWKTHVSRQDAQYYSVWGTIQTPNCIRMDRLFDLSLEMNTVTINSGYF